MSPKKSNKGKVAIAVKNGFLRLRWRYLGTQYNLYTGLPDEPISRTVAEGKANAIALDILSNNFDTTLAKYKPQKAKPKPENRSALDLYLEFLEFKRSQVSPVTAKKYESLVEDLKRNPKPENILEILGDGNAPETVKRKLEWLDQCYKFHGAKNPYEQASHRLKIPPKLKPQPFTSEEVQLILDGFAKMHPHYLPYMQFCLSTGVRVQEARFLKWDQLSPDLTRIQILDYKRGKTRSFKLPDMAIAAIKAVKGSALEGQKSEKNDTQQSVEGGDLFVFTSTEGKQIDAGNFRKRYWIPVLEAQGIDYRRPYMCRSTAISHALSKGANPMAIAAVTGHDVATLYNEYAGFIESSPKMPNLF